jgi:hypothetical protein
MQVVHEEDRITAQSGSIPRKLVLSQKGGKREEFRIIDGGGQVTAGFNNKSAYNIAVIPGKRLM